MGAFLGIINAHLIKHGGNEFILHPPRDDDSWLYVLAIEFFFTAIFMTTIFHVKYSRISITKEGSMGAFIVCFSLYACIGLAAKVSDACFNPAIGFTVVIFNTVMADAGDPTYMRYLPSYIIGPLLGGVVGGVLTLFSMRV